MSVSIIAEAGVNHNGDLKIARRLIECAAEAGADLVKFQTFSAERLVTPAARMSGYQIQNTGADESQYEMLKRLELNATDHIALREYCDEYGIGFLSTAFDAECVNMLVDLGVNYIKVPSGEITNLPYLRHVASFGKKLILSTGMSDLQDVEAALHALIEAGSAREMITVLHCTTAYPTTMADANLRAMLTIRDELDVAVGYSDHTIGIEAAIAAVALGATIVEKHITLDREMPGPDHKASIEPVELRALVSAIRNVETALGDGVKRVTPAEAENIAFARKSIVACKPIRAGEVFDANNIAPMRPGTGISPMRWDDVIGQRASRDFEVNELIEL